MRKAIVAGNWKMNGSLVSNELLINAILKGADKLLTDSVDVVLCPPNVYLSQVGELLKNSSVMFGAQNISLHQGDGAHTGEVNARMVKEFGAQFVIVGHSERRANQYETDANVLDKIKHALHYGVTPLFCVGETLDQRESGKVECVISDQVLSVLEGLTEQDASKLVVAYEPVWAIGTGLTATPEQAQEVHSYIRSLFSSKYGQGIAEKVRILYGGSVNATNASDLFKMKDIDGGLVGGASLKADEFLEICRSSADLVVSD
ncbi:MULTISPECIES: triose-phosphate isomerase [Nitrincola]|uniref:Triosephosphate isomerase n=1 Tax=Nitrincola nitratireducens TaxID=1229521 RepID=W9UQ82_9GAMM|nr:MULTISPECIES: triose-phosphate isomerase [Nitrincola]EXJ09279.1 Bifunctional PGK/TIM [Nitrincola nitratireducens]